MTSFEPITGSLKISNHVTRITTEVRKKYENASIAFAGFEGVFLSIDLVGLTDKTVERLERSLTELDEALSMQ